MARIVFCALHFTYFRNYDSVIRALAADGHQVHLTADEPESMGGLDLVQNLSASVPAITWGFAPSLDEWRWRPLALWVRRTLEYIRFLEPYYDPIPKYRHRAKSRASRTAVALFAVPGLNRPAIRRAAAAVLSAIERAIPAPDSLIEFFRQQDAAAVLLASVTNPGAPQLDHMKAAQSIGARTVMTVWSWDHLSGKAWIRIPPDRVLVWNHAQRTEAIDLHGLPAGRIVVTGAQCYDQWFGRRPSRSREEFLAEHGLDPQRPLLLYACSVLARPNPHETPFVLEWLDAVRRSNDPAIRDANILIRPHPERLEQWKGVDLSGYARVAVAGRNPIDDRSRDEYFDSLFFSCAVVGLVTSAFLEAAVVGRPVLTVMKPEYRMHQMGSPHFRYLVEVEGGLLHTAGDWPGHIRQLESISSNEAAEQQRLTRFIEAFVRPFGISRPATPVFVSAVEDVLAAPVSPKAAPAPVVARAAAHAFRHLIDMPAARRLLLSAQDLADAAAKERRLREERSTKTRLADTRAVQEAEAERERAARLDQKSAERRRKEAVVRAREQAQAARQRAKRRQQLLADVRARLRRVLDGSASR